MKSYRFVACLMLSLLAAACASRPEAARPKHAHRPPTHIPPPARPVQKPVVPAKPGELSASLADMVKAIWVADPGRTGIAIMREGAEGSIQFRGTELMPQQSVSKLWVAMTLLQQVDEGRLRLEDPVTITPADITIWSRDMRSRLVDGEYRTTLGGLLELAMLKSDNTANDRLLRAVGGPSAVRAMISAKGLGAIRFGPGEGLLQSATAGIPWDESYREGENFQKARALLTLEARKAAMDRYTADPPDGAAPLAIARALLRLKKGELLSRASTNHLVNLMIRCETGKQRLKAGVPVGWTFGHKTGTGQDLSGRTAGYNDVSFMVTPDGATYAVVVLMADTMNPVPKRMETMQSISRAVGAAHIP